MAKVKGNGTLVYFKESPVADFSIVTATATNATELATNLIDDDYKLMGCVFSATPAGYSYETIENEVCLEEAENVAPFQVSTIYNQGDIVGFGKVCYEATTGTTIPTDGSEVANPTPVDMGQTMWTTTDCDCAYPTVELGSQEVNTLDYEVAYCPTDDTTDTISKLCGEQVQVVIQYPCFTLNGDEIIPLETWAAKITSYQPQAIVPGEIMKFDATFTRTSIVRSWSVNA